MIALLGYRYLRAAPGRAALEAMVLGAAFVLAAGVLIFRSQLSDTQYRESSANVLVFSQASALEQLPISLAERLRGVTGVKTTAWAVRFGAIAQDGNTSIPAFAVSDNYLDLQQDIEIPPWAMKRWRDCKNCAIVGGDLLQQASWQTGDTVRLRSDSWRQARGEPLWPIEIAGFYRSKSRGVPANILFLHYDYLNDARTARTNTVGMFLLVANSPAEARLIPARVDGATEKSPDATRSFPQDAANAQVANQLSGLLTLFIFTGVITYLSIAVIVGNAFFWFMERHRADMRALAHGGLTRLRIVQGFVGRNLGVAGVGLLVSLLASLLIEWLVAGSSGMTFGWILPFLGLAVATSLVLAVGVTIPFLLRDPCLATDVS